MRRLFSILIATAAIAILPVSAAASVSTGMSDESARFMADPLFLALNITEVRVMVPWYAGTSQGWWDTWLGQAHAAGYQVLVALDHGPGTCGGAVCPAPSISAYQSALRALLARYPWIHDLQPWNEPNSPTEPTYNDPALAARFWNAASAVCPACTVVAGGMLDNNALRSYLTAYQGALSAAPSVWGLNNYYDATYFGTTGEDTILSATTGELWLTETGGLVAHGTLPYDPQRAAQSISWLYTTAASRPRLTRMYLYQWRSDPSNGFDSALLNADGSERPGYGVVAQHVGSRPGTPPPPSPSGPVAGGPGAALGAGSAPAGGALPAAAARPSPASALIAATGWSGREPYLAATEGTWTVRLSGKPPLRLGRRPLLLAGIACVRSSAGGCTGTLRVRSGAGSFARRFAVPVGRASVLRLSLAAANWRSLAHARRGRVLASLCASTRRCTPWRRLTVARV